jgi:hypothetical protein
VDPVGAAACDEVLLAVPEVGEESCHEVLVSH